MRVLLCILVLILALVFQATRDVLQTQGVAIHHWPRRGTAGKGICPSGRPWPFPSRAPPQPDRTPARL